MVCKIIVWKCICLQKFCNTDQIKWNSKIQNAMWYYDLTISLVCVRMCMYDKLRAFFVSFFWHNLSHICGRAIRVTSITSNLHWTGDEKLWVKHIHSRVNFTFVRLLCAFVKWSFWLNANAPLLMHTVWKFFNCRKDKRPFYVLQWKLKCKKSSLVRSFAQNKIIRKMSWCQQMGNFKIENATHDMCYRYTCYIWDIDMYNFQQYRSLCCRTLFSRICAFSEDKYNNMNNFESHSVRAHGA